MQNAPLNDWFSLLGIRCHEVKDMHFTILTDTMDAAESLFEPRGVPWQIVVDHEMTELQIDALTSRFCCHTDLHRGAKLFLRSLPFTGIHATVDDAGRISPPAQVLTHSMHRVAM